jgi:hypothetical protein
LPFYLPLKINMILHALTLCLKQLLIHDYTEMTQIFNQTNIPHQVINFCMNGVPPNMPPGLTFVNNENGNGTHHRQKSKQKQGKNEAKANNAPHNYPTNNQLPYSKSANFSSQNVTSGVSRQDSERGDQKVDYIKQYAPTMSNFNANSKKHPKSFITTNTFNDNNKLTGAQSSFRSTKSKFYSLIIAILTLT